MISTLIFLVLGIHLAYGQEEVLRFMAIGDWGQGVPSQQDVAWAMAEWAEQQHIDFIVTAGDNFYPKGIHSVDDIQWTWKWYNVYYNDSIKDMDWYVTVGNHDYGDSDEEQWNQVEFSKIEPRWILPDLWYSFYRTVGSTRIHFIMIDTEVITWRKGNYTEMMEWLEAELATSTGDWKLVIGHRHIVSASADFGPISDVPYNELRPLFIRYGVHMYICGHDHQLQHLSNIDTLDVDYFISGGGGSPLSSRYSEEVAATLNTTYGIKVDAFHWSYGFISFTVSETEITAQMVNRYTEVLYTYTRRR